MTILVDADCVLSITESAQDDIDGKEADDDAVETDPLSPSEDREGGSSTPPRRIDELSQQSIGSRQMGRHGKASSSLEISSR